MRKQSNGLYVHIKGNGKITKLRTSIDGMVWSERASTADINWESSDLPPELKILSEIASTRVEMNDNHAVSEYMYIPLGSLKRKNRSRLLEYIDGHYIFVKCTLIIWSVWQVVKVLFWIIQKYP